MIITHPKNPKISKQRIKRNLAVTHTRPEHDLNVTEGHKQETHGMLFKVRIISWAEATDVLNVYRIPPYKSETN